ncbi:type II toxin-antitoxin system antitoxin DNA ADP-ribosyl glycohydrolase DarG [Acanthopleuribacter pedis]|uniref:Macro domain-containing protein n=1 Tax=Acanthopleuribacter pedis TaxID=442870 RepID=A0A8J7QJ39_9BACT|nr:macro domain-containing protein [Acanthopleuribacter pedis]MBO1319133.1 macro domain-containing protein [Acanthopleuribacter pedis]
MIEFKHGDLLREDVEALVNTVNCVGVMGRGIALQFKKAFPENFLAYAEACKQKMVQPGRVFVFETGQLTSPAYLLNFPTKRHWRGKSRLDDVKAGLIDLVQVVKERNIRSIAVPPLGCGLGGLAWDVVKEEILKAFEPLEQVRVVIFEPKGAPAAKEQVKAKREPLMTPGRAALVVLADRYLSGLMDTSVSLLELHKLLYFMQAAGEPLNLVFKKASYGPYAENLRHVLNEIEGWLLTGCADGGDKPYKPLCPMPEGIKLSRRFLADLPSTGGHVARVSDLVAGFESPFGLELLATVHWVVDRESVTSLERVIEKTYNWNERKRRFSEYQIGLAAKTLTEKGWIEPLSP